MANAAKIKPTTEQIQVLNAAAAEYGYSVDADGRIIHPSGKPSSCTITMAPKCGASGRFMVSSTHRADGVAKPNAELLFSGHDLGVFLREYWFATKRRPAASD